jgi:hypothetical protein
VLRAAVNAAGTVTVVLSRSAAQHPDRLVSSFAASILTRRTGARERANGWA